MSTSKVKFLHSGLTGAPVLSGTVGSLIAVLDAALVNGWGTATVDSLVISGGIATITRAAGHPFEPDVVSEISGAGLTSGNINGQRKVLTTTGTSYTVDATGIADQTATGTIQHKVAPLGWTQPVASAGNVAVYRLNAADGTGMYLRVDDSGAGNARNARVQGYEAMTDLSTGTGLQQPATGGGFWAKSATLDSTARSWTIVGDDRTFYMRSVSLSGFHVTQGHGDFVSRKSPDPYRCVHHSSSGDQTVTSTSDWDVALVEPFGAGSGFAGRALLARGVSGIGSQLIGKRSAGLPLWPSSGNISSGGTSLTHLAYPNAADNALLLTPIGLWEPNCLRGNMRGVYYCAQNVAGHFSNHAVVTGVDILPGRRLRALPSGTGFYFVDVTGPWAE